jgi:molecular chaperone GrpE
MSDQHTNETQMPEPTDLQKELEQLAGEKAELQDRVLRTQAEFQNLRKRVEKERSELFEYASMEAVRAMLPVLDDFERSLKVESADKEYVKGMELIY